MNFFLNKGMGHGNSGVEHAQFYRAELFNRKNIPFKIVFNNFLPELHKHAKEWNLRENQLIGIYDYFLADNPDDYLENGLNSINQFSEEILSDQTNTQRIITRQSTGNYKVEIQRVKNYSEERKILIVSDSRVILSSGESGNQHKVSWSYRSFNSRESVPATFFIENFKGQNYRFNTFEEFNNFFIVQLIKFFGEESVFMVDRGNENEEALVTIRERYPKIGLVDVIHAAHLSSVENNHYLWNNHYQFMFENIDSFNKVVVSTKLQRDQIIADLGSQYQDKIVAIPVGGVPAAANPKKWNGQVIKFVTASRLHSEKHISHIIRAIAILRNKNLNAELYIYGAGADLPVLKKLIGELQLDKYVKLMGLSQQMIKDLADYDAFVSASYSEGFGLTYIEAIANGLPIASYANLYGAQELIENGVNGFLAEFERTEESDAVEKNIEKLSQAMANIFESVDRYQQLSKGAAELSKVYTDASIADQWLNFIES